MERIGHNPSFPLKTQHKENEPPNKNYHRNKWAVERTLLERPRGEVLSSDKGRSKESGISSPSKHLLVGKRGGE